MKNLGTTHLVLLLATVSFIVLTCLAASRLSKRWQNALFIFGAVMCAGGIFWRYALNLTLSPLSLHLDTLLIQMLQVCNFNFILVLLMLIPKFELARQYSVMFSMFAAATVMLSIPSRYATAAWYDPDFLNFWLNHVFAIALPLWMVASGRLKPQKKYIIPVSVCVILYFLTVYGGTELLRALGEIAPDKSFSYVHDPAGIGLLEWIYKLIPTPCFYLAPLIAPMLGFFYLLALAFEKLPTLVRKSVGKPQEQNEEITDARSEIEPTEAEPLEEERHEADNTEATN